MVTPLLWLALNVLGETDAATYPGSVSHPFDRYAGFTDLKVLKEVSAKPLRKSMRVNTLKYSPAEFLSWAKSKSWMTEPVPWCPEGFFVDRVNRDEALGKDLFHLLGGCYMQEASSMLPVALLDPQPGERVLDMSAAPGSKTTQIAARMGRADSQELQKKRGLLIANDVQEKRIWSLLTNLQRCGVVDVVVTRKVGQWFAGNMTEVFDRVLCDAPCTAQGTARKDSDALKYCSDDNIGKMAKLQRELLESAIHACKVGGRIVYSTCTLTPEENEGVVMSMLHKFPGMLEVVDPNEILAASGGRVAGSTNPIDDSALVQDWIAKNSNSPTASRYPLFRIWPQTFDTEGFFCAVLKKVAPTKDRGEKSKDDHRFELVPPSRARSIAARLEDWFGAKFLRDDEVLIEYKEQLSVLPESILKFYLPTNPYMSGLPFGKSTSHGLTRLSHEMATLRGLEATKQVVTLSESDIRDAMKGVNVKYEKPGMDDGDVLIAMESAALGKPIILGRGMLKNGIILNRLPREMVRMFA